MALRTCPVCQGTKKVKGLGMMKTDCPICEATGKVDPSVETPRRAAATPLGRDSLPEDYYDNKRNAKTAGMQDANFAFKNRPATIQNKDTQNTPAGNMPGAGAANAAPVVLTPQELVDLKHQIKPREDNIGMPKVTLSPAVQAELKAIEDAKLAAEAKEAVAVDPALVTDEEMFGGVKCEVETSEVAAAHIVAPVITTPGANSGKKRSRQAKAAQG